MKRKIYYTSVISLLTVMTISCSRGALKEQQDPREMYEKSMELYNKGKYFKAQTELQRLIFSFPGQPFIDSAQYYLAMSHYNMERYPEAVGEFRRLLMAYPVSPLADDSQYHLGMCHYEQSPDYSRDPAETYLAIDEFTMFINRYPQSPLAEEARARLGEMNDKLAKKMFKNGELYLKTHDFEPALIYFGQVRDNYPESEWARMALYYSAEALTKLERKSDALETFQNFVIAFPDHELSKKARKHIDNLQAGENGG